MKRKASNFIFSFMSLVLLIGLTSCKGEVSHNGFSLQRFKVINEYLASTMKGLCDSSFILKKDYEVIILKLNFVDSIPLFIFTSAPQNSINNYYIFSSNMRIVGYIEEEYLPTEVIVLSNINNKIDFEMTFYKFVLPTSDKKRFSYIYFPNDQYIADKNGHALPPPFFDPFYYRFEYKNNKIVYTSNLE